MAYLSQDAGASIRVSRFVRALPTVQEGKVRVKRSVKVNPGDPILSTEPTAPNEGQIWPRGNR